MNVPELRLGTPTAPLVTGKAVTVRLVVRNTGPEVERYALEPTGPLAAWTRLSDAEVRIWPGEDMGLTVTVELPAASQPPAGPASVGVAARTADGAHAVAEVPAEVAPRFDLAVEGPAPHAITTTRRALVHGTVVNRGNTPLGIRLTVRESEGRLLDEAGPAGTELVLGPGQSATVPFVLRAARTSWLGRPTRCDYTVQAASQPLTVAATGVVTLEPILRRWWFVVVAALVALLANDGVRVPVAIVLAVLLVVLVSVVLGRLSWLARARQGPPRPP